MRRLVVSLLIVLAAAPLPSWATPAPESPKSLAEAVAACGDSPDAVLDLVRGRLAYRPYRGFLKGPEGAFDDGTANAADAAWLLLDVLRRKGHEARLAFGTISDDEVTAILAKALPARPPAVEVAAILPGDELADPGNDEALRAVVAEHVWVQVRAGEGLRDLDPFRLNARREGPVPPPESTADDVPEESVRTVRVEVFARAETEEAPRPVLSVQIPAVGLYGKPLAFVNLGVDGKARGKRADPSLLRPALWTGQSISVGEHFGGPVPGPRDPAGRLGGVFGEEPGEPSVPAAPPAIAEIYVDLTLDGAGRPCRTERRYLYLAGEDGLDRLDDLTALCVCFDAPPPDAAKAFAAAALKGASAEEKPLPDTGDLTDADLERAKVLFGRAASSAEAVAAWLAEATRGLAERLDAAHGTLSAADDVRIIAVSLDGRRNRLSTDLVFDSRATWPRPGTKKSARAAVLAARGILAAETEGEVLAAVLSKASVGAPGTKAGPLTVRTVFEAARAAKTRFTALGAENAARLEDLPLPARTRRILGERLAAGRIAILPVKPVDIGGRLITAWLEADRETGEWRGVFEDGRHQAIAEGEAVSGIQGAFAGFGFAFIGGFSGTLFSFATTVLELLTPEGSFRIVALQAIERTCAIDWNSVILEAWGDTEGLILLGGGPEGLLIGQMGMLAGQATAIHFLRSLFEK